MKTVWGDKLDPNHVLEEYPRPQLRRDSYLNLNGAWDFAITETEASPKKYEGEILVPFSPESELSGVNRTLLPSQTLWYRRVLRLPDGFNRGRVLLHFGAIDQIATVYVNETELASHVGGYTPFSVDITAALQDENTIAVKVRDYSDASHYSRGKQKTKRGGIWYTAQSGIWQTVWMEPVAPQGLKQAQVQADLDQQQFVVGNNGAFLFQRELQELRAGGQGALRQIGKVDAQCAANGINARKRHVGFGKHAFDAGFGHIEALRQFGVGHARGLEFGLDRLDQFGAGAHCNLLVW